MIIKFIEEAGGIEKAKEQAEKQIKDMVNFEKLVILREGDDYDKSRRLTECLAASLALNGVFKEALRITANTAYFDMILDRAAKEIEKERLDKIWNSVNH